MFLLLLMLNRDDEQLSLVKVTPVTTIPNVFELSYYANSAGSVFAIESIIGLLQLKLFAVSWHVQLRK